MDKIKQIITCFEVNASQRETSRITGVSRPVVSEYIAAYQKSGLSRSDIEGMKDSEIIGIFETQNPAAENQRLNRLKVRFPDYIKRLKEKGMTLQILWEDYRSEDPEPCSYSQFCDIFSRFKKEESVTMHIEYKYGDKLLCDFTGAKLPVYEKETGAIREVEVFVAILGASQLTYVEAVESQKIQDVIKVTENSFQYFGGVPNAVVFDCLKSVVTKGNKYEPVTNIQFNHFLNHYDVISLPARPHHPKDKALVEGAVKIVYTRIFTRLKHMKHFSVEDLNVTIRELLEIHNSTALTNMKISRRDLFEGSEKSSLRSLPASRYDKHIISLATVLPNYHVYHQADNHYYSVPWKTARKQVKIIAGSHTVEIFHDGQRVAIHERKQTHGYSTAESHMPSHHRFIHELSPERVLELADAKSEIIRDYAAELIKSGGHPEKGCKAALGVIALTDKYSVERVSRAIKRAVHFKSFSYRSIVNILTNNLDQVDDWSEESGLAVIPVDHENIRGSDYYEEVSGEYRIYN